MTLRKIFQDKLSKFITIIYGNDQKVVPLN